MNYDLESYESDQIQIKDSDNDCIDGKECNAVK